jgi:hypothetical protein
MPGQTYIFRKDEPYAQILIVPRKILYEIQPMTSGEQSARGLLDDSIQKFCKKFTENDWHDNKGNNFDDKYRILNRIHIKKEAKVFANSFKILLIKLIKNIEK